MILLVGYVLPALLISSAALIALTIARSAPPGIRFGFALIGLLAWLVPWSLLSLPPVLPEALSLGEWVGDSGAKFSATKQSLSGALEALLPSAAQPKVWWLFIVAPGVLWIVIDLIRYSATVNRWRRDSLSGQKLASYLPAGIQGRKPRIRIVANSSVAVATGWLKPTIWVGDRVVEAQELRIALTHESIHIYRRDPIWLMLVGLIARAFWFNPIVYALKRQAVLAIESSCDEECARLLGRQRYRNTLARLILKGQERHGFALAPTLHSSSVDLLRLASLKVRPRMDGVAWVAVTIVSLSCFGGVALGSVGLEEPNLGDGLEVQDWSRNGYDVPRLWSYREGDTE